MSDDETIYGVIERCDELNERGHCRVRVRWEDASHDAPPDWYSTRPIVVGSRVRANYSDQFVYEVNDG